ncbi:transposase [Cohnella ginsengisoli]|uniref:Transposase n=1 Tax=Cohnella ginsengisoli TaxID=425004 RepID=A0A9X4KF28_9BACL|nr:IS1595 family transposase [Cohnella ginsengisoli]MDG0790828.1 transposase [Cohnella ginsengisoli]
MSSGFSIRDSIPSYAEDDCAEALFAAKWPDGFRCPRCSHAHYYDIASRRRRLFECRSCSHQTSLTAGTALEGTRTPLAKWFKAMYLMQFGISAVLLAELICVTYKTAWLINHKLRHVIGEQDRARPLEGSLQLLGEYYGYEYHRYFSDKLVHGALKPQPIVIGASLDAAGGGRSSQNEGRRRS